MSRRTQLILALVTVTTGCRARDDAATSAPPDAAIAEAAAPYLPARAAPSESPDAPLTVVEGVLFAQRSELNFCYRTAAKVNPKLEGQAVLGVTIGANGSVTDVRPVSNTGLDADLMSCVSGVLRRAKFPPPADGGAASVNVPLSFHPPRNPDAGNGAPR